MYKFFIGNIIKLYAHKHSKINMTYLKIP